jgi:hypothetical protein
MDREQYYKLIEELEKVQNLLILIANKSGAKSDEIGKVLGLGSSAPRKILAGIGVRKRRG